VNGYAILARSGGAEKGENVAKSSVFQFIRGDYFEDLLRRLPTATAEDLWDLLPDRWEAPAPASAELPAPSPAKS